MNETKCNEMIQINGVYRLTLVVNKDGSAFVIDANRLDVNDIIDCGTSQIKEIEIELEE